MPAEDRREQILDVAHAIVDADGFHAATLNRIAAEAGVTRTILYHRFGDLSGLFVALIDREAARAGAQFAAAVAPSNDGEGEGEDDERASESLGVFGRAFAGILRAIDAHPATWRLFLIPPEGAPPELHERLAESQDRVRAYLAAGLVEVNPDLADPEYTAHVIHGAGRELLCLRLTDPEHATHERLLAHVARLTPALLRRTG
ncbi:MAG TPA: helix-turn-helix domain-containing protein [Baekduia sp.]|uniref:TetR/AcrR family transcriptional regulator n=1 Tax=Baekduia sp. TaxID=2600305 RepID=UPI002D79C451|nr:helix-turn-helix domain-containing protein [Baekduia sp.]HET6506976.1 helix-turn-helix domain-containing protein [Baekduia sp.]